MFVSSRNSYVEILESGSFGKWFGHEGGTLVNEIIALIKETLESPLGPSSIWGHSKKAAVYEPGSEINWTWIQIKKKQKTKNFKQSNY